MSAGSVINIKHCKKYDVYIGRGSIWGNPFVMGKDGNRDEVIAKYEDYLVKNPDLMGQLRELKGKVLGCYCHPESCHGDVLLKYADALPNRLIILGIDPGINNTGWAVGEYDPVTEKMVIIKTGVIHANQDTSRRDDTKRDFKIFGNVVSLSVYQEHIQLLCQAFKPSFITCEDAFYNPRTPNAYLSIKLCIQAIRNILYYYRDNLYLSAPKLIKQATSGKGTSGKLDMTAALGTIENLTVNTDVTTLTEHEVDAIAIAYTFTKVHLPEIPEHVVSRHMSTEFNVLISGSRSLSSDPIAIDFIKSILDMAIPALATYKKVTLVHGGARGVDTIAGDWFKSQSNPNIHMEVYPADWDKHGKAAGMIRNDEMIAKVIKKQCVLLAFHDGSSPGTKHAISRAIKNNIPVKVWSIPSKN